MRFSIIVPAFNSERWLGNCVDSVLAQDFKDWELVLVDDGSTDATGVLANEFARQHERIIALHEENAGQLFARRAGVRGSRGEYLLFLDSDDELEPYALSSVNAALEKSGEIDMVLFLGQAFDEGGPAGDIVGSVEAPAGEAPAKEASAREVPVDAVRRIVAFSARLNSVCLKAFRRSLLLDDATDYSCLRDARHGEDKAMLLGPLTLARQCVYLPKRLYRYRINEKGMTRGLCMNDVSSLLENEVFSLLAAALRAWGLDSAHDERLMGAYYLRNYIATYFNLRKACALRGELHLIRSYPWGSAVDRNYFKARYVCALSPYEQIKYLAARFRL